MNKNSGVPPLADQRRILNSDFYIPAKKGSDLFSYYEFVDENVRNRRTCCYKIEDIDLNGKSTMHGPVSAVPRRLGRD